MVLDAVVLATLLAGAPDGAPPLTAVEQRGREIYLHGTSAAGRDIAAYFGTDADNEIGASVVPCASCHGADGRGVAEGTVSPSDIRWNVLSKFFVAAEGERRRPAYDATTLTRAVREAVDAGGMPLGAIMPRYRIDDRDLDDLVAYLRRLGNEPRPGLDDSTITIATVVPLTGPRAAAGEAMRGVIAGYLDDVNASGGLFGRRFELEAIDAGAPPERIAESLAGEVFAVAVGSWEAIDEVVRKERVPVVTPFAPSAESRSVPSAFFLFPDLESQALALIEFAAGRAAAGVTPRVVVKHDRSNSAAAAAAESVVRRCETLGWTVLDEVSGDVDFVVQIGGDVDAIAEIDGPQILIAGAAMTRSLFELKSKTIFIAVPALPDDLTADGRREMTSFAGRHRLSGSNRAAEIAAYAAAKVLVEAIRRSGRDVTREKLIATLEQLYALPTEVTRPVTFAPGRHIAAAGAYIVTVDFDRRTFVPAAAWIPAPD